MGDTELGDIRQLSDRIPDDWRIQVGDDGGSNRRLNSDPVLWRFAGDVAGLRVLDAGCGTGYLSRKLHDAGALVTGVDLSPRMVEIARSQRPDMGLRVDSCSELTTLGDAEFDPVVSNYVLMDTPELTGTLAAFRRILRPGGAAVLGGLQAEEALTVGLFHPREREPALGSPCMAIACCSW